VYVWTTGKFQVKSFQIVEESDHLFTIYNDQEIRVDKVKKEVVG